MSSREDSKQLRRDAIVSAARTLLRDSGGIGFSMRTLAEASGVSIATPYNLFGSKQAVLIGVLEADLAQYQAQLEGFRTQGVEMLFDAINLMGDFLAQEPEFYRNVFACVSRDGGPELQFIISGPRFLLWKGMLRSAINAELLSDEVDADALTITIGQLLSAGTYQWCQDLVSLPEMLARARFGVSAVLLAFATQTGQPQLRKHLLDAQDQLQTIWRTLLTERLREGTLDERAQMLLADQLQHLEPQPDGMKRPEESTNPQNKRKTA